ncbi:MAG: type IV toxin-antitoxin system AbiEi family antitoxin domain-containing protein [Candidatus Sumerlaeota bacterium]|nr:type IV toxin-antitoxin system AbiEi family antitoxin domain-containing protein [Candidatus Sumerlaeota bacterium]
MTAMEWRLYLEERRREGKSCFTIAELANVSGLSPSVLNVQLARLVKRGVIARHARGRYGAPGALAPEVLLPGLDASAYLTAAYALNKHGLITQVPAALSCFTNRRHNRSRERVTAAGRFVFVCVKPPIYALPRKGVLADPEQALCDFVYLTLRSGGAPEGLVTFRNLDRLRKSRLFRLARRYPSTIGERIAAILQRSSRA